MRSVYVLRIAVPTTRIDNGYLKCNGYPCQLRIAAILSSSGDNANQDFRLCYTADMTDDTHDIGNAGDATTPDKRPLATPGPAAPLNGAPDTSVSGGAGGAMTALADDLDYTLTVGQALQQIAAAGRKVPSARTIQRYCTEGKLAGKKIRTTFGQEYLINEKSLLQLIEQEAIVTSDTGTASVAKNPDTELLATPSSTIPHNGASDTSVMATPASPLTLPEGERRTLVDVLIENARLLADADGKNELIAEMRRDKHFLQSEITKRDDSALKELTTKTLETLQTIATGRRNDALALPPLSAEIIRQPHEGTT